MKDISLQALVRALREDIDEVSYKKSGLENPDKADRDKDKDISPWEKKVGAAIEKNLEEGPDHEVAMAMSSLKEIVSNATQLMQKLGMEERNIPGWIQDHITNSENYIEQANQGFHELHNEEASEDSQESTSYKDQFVSINIAENTGYQDFAQAVANVLMDHYGEHNYKPFVQTLVSKLKS